MRTPVSLLTIASLAAAAAMAQGPSGAAPRLAADHYDPAALNESAADAVRRGDVATAWILLERAARIAPHDARIAANLREVRAHRAGAPAPAAPQAPVAPGAAEPRIPPEPPAIWPVRP